MVPCNTFKNCYPAGNKRNLIDLSIAVAALGLSP